MIGITTAYAAEGGISVHLAPHILGYIGNFPITSTLFTAWVCMLFLGILAVLVKSKIALIPSKFQSILELLLGGAYDYIAHVLESKVLAKRYFPVIMTIFLFILVMNWMALLPGVTSVGFYKQGELVPLLYPPATDLNITIAFALIAFVTIEFAGVVVIGARKYIGKFFNFHSPLAFVIGLIEFISELARLVAFSFRLFGNIFAGKVLILVVMFLVTPYIVPVPLMAYELFVGFIQAFIFAILTLYFIKIAITKPH